MKISRNCWSKRKMAANSCLLFTCHSPQQRAGGEVTPFQAPELSGRHSSYDHEGQEGSIHLEWNKGKGMSWLYIHHPDIHHMLVNSTPLCDGWTTHWHNVLFSRDTSLPRENIISIDAMVAGKYHLHWCHGEASLWFKSQASSLEQLHHLSKLQR